MATRAQFGADEVLDKVFQDSESENDFSDSDNVDGSQTSFDRSTTQTRN